MTTWTYLQLKTKVQNDLDMREELFVTDSEMLDYCNQAIDEAKAEIEELHKDYFLTFYDLPLITGQGVYNLPTKILAVKIRSVMYLNGNQIYEIRQIRGSKKFQDIAFSQNFVHTTEDYRYFIYNDDISTGYQLYLVPNSREDGPVVRIWYTREPNRMAQDTDTLDIPFPQFIITFMKAMCRAKENGGEMPPDAAAMVEQQRKLMVDTLTQMVDDDDTTVEQDFSHYMDHS